LLVGRAVATWIAILSDHFSVRLKDFIAKAVPRYETTVVDMFRVPEMMKRDVNTFRFQQNWGFKVETHDEILVRRIRKLDLWKSHADELCELFGLLLTRSHLNFGPGT
jgi:hypothetical protein